MAETPRRLIGEILAASGPRKSPSAQGTPVAPELGEDAGGILLMDGSTLCLWTADGMSDADSSLQFSSALLAQDLGRLFTHLAITTPIPFAWNPEAAETILSPLLAGLRETWQTRLEDPRSAAAILSQLKALSTSSATTPYLECASTFSAAFLESSGRARVMSIGDSYLAVHQQGTTGFFAFKKGSVTLRVYLENSGTRLEVLAPPVEVYQNEQVDLLILGTDGTRDTFQTLNQVLGQDFKVTPTLYHRLKEQLSQVKPTVQDDKTLGLAARIHED